MNRLRALIIFALCMLPTAAFIQTAYAVTPPTPTQTTASAKFTWVMPTLRSDLKTPLALSEIKQVNIYVSSLASVITVSAPATSYAYALAPGVCIKQTDSAQATAVDTLGQESAASAAVHPTADICGPNPPASPSGLTVSAG